MAGNYIDSIQVVKVRHLHDIQIPLTQSQPNLILTGRNGSGKTSLLLAIRYTLMQLFYPEEDSDVLQDVTMQDSVVRINWTVDADALHERVVQGNFILAGYVAEREFHVANVQHAERMDLKDAYKLYEHPGQEFVKYLVDYKMKEALYRGSGKQEQADKINQWFERFTDVLRRIFADNALTLDFDIETFAFHIHEPGKEPFSFDELSSGYAAVLDTVTDLMVRMEKKHHGSYDLPGIVLIDEVEAHLHLSLQKDILPIFSSLFPQIQFIVTTHSPFVLSSVNNAVIYDLENQTMVQDQEGLSNLPYSGIVEGYFHAPELSQELRRKFFRFKELVKKDKLTDEDFEELGELEVYLDEIPDYLAVNIMADYQKLKLELEQKVEAET